MVLLFGARTPFILRPEAESKGLTNRYKLVSDCYLDGWMDVSFFGHTANDGDGNVISGSLLGSTGERTRKVLKQQHFFIR